MTMVVKTIRAYDVMYYDSNNELLVERVMADAPSSAASILKNRHPKEGINIYDIHIAEGDFINAGEE